MSPGRVLAAVAAAVVAAVAVATRRRLSGERRLLAAAVVAGLAIFASGLLSELPDPRKTIEDVASALGSWTYVLVGTMAFLETGAFVGLIAPGEFTVIVGGVIAGQGEIQVLPLLGIAWFCCVLGDSASFFVGRRLGRSFLERHGPRVKITHERLERVDEYFAHHGGKTVLIGRFIGLVRAMAPFIAGASGMTYGRFIPYSVIGTGLWSSFYTLLGYFFYRSFDRVAEIAGRATLVFAVLVGTVVLVVWARRRLRHPEERRRLAAWLDRQGRRPALRPLAAVARPLWRRVLRPGWHLAAPRVRFVWGRLTPGDLGIELTTTLAVTGVGAFGFVAYADRVRRDRGPTHGDGTVLDVARELRVDAGLDAAEAVSAVGSTPVVAGLLLVGLALLAWRRRPVELAVLLLGAIAVYAAVHVGKAQIDRPRPPDPQAGARLSAFPSGHAAYATAYVAMAVVAARILPGLVSRAAFVTGAVVVAAAIGLSRVYLEVHWWSDVVAGWGLGAAIFGAFAALGLIVDYVRQNGEAPSAPRRAEPTAATSTDRG